MAYIPIVPQRIIEITQLFSVHYFEYTSSYRFSGESHDFWELLYVDNGAVQVVAGEATVPENRRRTLSCTLRRLLPVTCKLSWDLWVLAQRTCWPPQTRLSPKIWILPGWCCVRCSGGICCSQLLISAVAQAQEVMGMTAFPLPRSRSPPSCSCILQR